VALGIFAGRMFGLSMSEASWPTAAFFILALIAWNWTSGRNRFLLRACAGFALFFLGVFAEAFHRPGPPPEIDAGSRETVTLEGCVVEPTVFSSTREQFTLELDSTLKARARVSFALDDPDAVSQKLDYGQRVEIEARIRTITTTPDRSITPPGSRGRTYIGRRQ
jgi:hypothetical protein